MTIRTDLNAALAPTIALLVHEFGVTANLRRPVSVDQADASVGYEIETVPTIHDPIEVLVSNITKAQAERRWGRETEVAFEGLAVQGVGIAIADLIIPTTGTKTGAHLEVLDIGESDIAGVMLLGLREIPALLDRGF